MTTYHLCEVHRLACSTAYTHHGCRCVECSAWASERDDERRVTDRRRETYVDSPTCPRHGIPASTAYRREKCRCLTCKAWNSAREKRRRVKARNHERWQRFDAALRSDPMLLVELARVAARAVEKNGDKSG